MNLKLCSIDQILSSTSATIVRQFSLAETASYGPQDSLAGKSNIVRCVGTAIPGYFSAGRGIQYEDYLLLQCTLTLFYVYVKENIVTDLVFG
jgi:hypothetical protein